MTTKMLEDRQIKVLGGSSGCRRAISSRTSAGPRRFEAPRISSTCDRIQPRGRRPEGVNRRRPAGAGQIPLNLWIPPNSRIWSSTRSSHLESLPFRLQAIQLSLFSSGNELLEGFNIESAETVHFNLHVHGLFLFLKMTAGVGLGRTRPMTSARIREPLTPSGISPEHTKLDRF